MSIERDEYISDQQALVRCLQALYRVVEPMVEAADARDEVLVGARIKRALGNLAEARRELGKLALRPRMSELLQDWTEDELEVLRQKLGLVPVDEDDEEE